MAAAVEWHAVVEDHRAHIEADAPRLQSIVRVRTQQVEDAAPRLVIRTRLDQQRTIVQLTEIPAAAGDERHDPDASRNVPGCAAADHVLLQPLDGGDRRRTLDVVRNRHAQFGTRIRRIGFENQRAGDPHADARVERRRAAKLARRGEQAERATGRRRFRRIGRTKPLRAEPRRAARDLEPPGFEHTLRGSPARRRRKAQDDERRGRDASADPPHFGTTAIVTSPLSPPRGTTTIRSENATRKLMSTVREASKKLSISASSSGSTRRIRGPGGIAPIENCPCALSVKLPTIVRVTGSKATTCAPKIGAPFFVTRPETLP